MHANVSATRTVVKSTVLGGLVRFAGDTSQANDAAGGGRLWTAIDADTSGLTALFKDLHEHPELGFMETRTANLVARELTALGFLGVGDPTVFANARKEGKFVPYSAHNPNFVVDLAGIAVGTKVATTMVTELLVTH